MVSIIILTHNASDYIKITLESLKLTVDAEYEVIVIDNDSDIETQKMLLDYKEASYIDKLLLLNENTFFAGGNNLGLKLVSEQSDWVLLLNSDVKILNKYWLKKLVDFAVRGGGKKEKDCRNQLWDMHESRRKTYSRWLLHPVPEGCVETIWAQ